MALCSAPRLLPDSTHCLLQTNPPHLDLAEDLAMLLNLNECSALNTLQHRYHSHLPYTYAGPSLVAIRPGPDAGTHAGKVRGWEWDPSWYPGVRGFCAGRRTPNHRTHSGTLRRSWELQAGRWHRGTAAVVCVMLGAGDALRNARGWRCCWLMLGIRDAGGCSGLGVLLGDAQEWRCSQVGAAPSQVVFPISGRKSLYCCTRHGGVGAGAGAGWGTVPEVH